MPLGYNGVLEYNENGAVAMYDRAAPIAICSALAAAALTGFLSTVYCSTQG